MPEDLALDISYAETIPLTCPTCGYDFDFDAWLIVDATERPDLVKRIRDKTVHDIACSQCGAALGQVNVPLLVVTAGETGLRDTSPTRPTIIFSPAQGTTAQQDQEQATTLVVLLREQLGGAWQDAWLAQGLPNLPREMLPEALSGNPSAAVAEDKESTWEVEAPSSQYLPEVMRALGDMLGALPPDQLEALSKLFARASRPEAAEAALAERPDLEAAFQQALARQAGDEVTAQRASLALRVQQFIQAQSWDESQRIVEAHHELLSDEADALLGQLIKAARAASDSDAAATFEEHRDLLRRCREVGIPRSFAEKILLPETLAQAKVAGITPEQALEAARQMDHSVSPELQLILQELEHPAHLTDMARRAQLCRQALALLTRDENPRLWAVLQGELGNSLVECLSGDRAENLEQAIVAYRQALEVMTPQAMPVEWAATMMNLAIAYKNRIQGDRAENLEQTIAAYRQALEVRTRTAMPLEWAQAMMNLAAAYSDRIRGDRAENLEQAIAAYRQALEVMTRQAMPVEWAATMTSLANTYYFRTPFLAEGDRAENLEQAIAVYRQALEVMTRQAMPVEWARAMNNLANAYSDRIRGDRAENLEQAIATYRQALEVRTRQAIPIAWAQTTSNLALAYSSRIRGDRAENLEQAIVAYRQALEVMTPQATPVEWAQTMNNLAIAYADRVRDDPAENLELAIAAYRQALEVMKREAIPVEWSTTTMNLANAYRDRIRGNRAENFEQAIATYKQALEVMTRQAMPVGWARVTMNLANTYYFRTPFLAEGDRAESLEQAIATYQQALQVMTCQAIPVEWARTMNNLANAYQERILGDRAENLEQAIAAYRQVLEVFTPDRLPYECRLTARNLANLCFAEGQYAQVIEPHKLAMHAADQLLQASLVRSNKEVELGELQGLPANAAYALAKLDRLEEAVEAIEAGRARLLAEALEANRRDLEQLEPLGHGDLLARYRAAAEWIASLQAQAAQPATSRSPNLPTYQSTLYQDMDAACSKLNAAIDAIREVPGYEDFFLPPAFAKIRQAATPKAPMIYLAVTSAGGLALVVRPPQTLRVSEARRVSVEAIWLDGITEPQLREVVAGPASATTIGGYLRAYNGWRRDSGNEAARDAWHAALDATTHWLWDKLMGDVVRALTAQGCQQAVLVPTGLLALLPLHAAWTEDGTAATGRRYALDALALSYAPNAGALAAGLETAARVRPDGVLAVDNPDGSLVFSTHEVEAVLSYFPAGHGKVLRGSAAIRAAVLDQLTSYPVYHLSTHGWAGWDEPLQGGLLLAGGQRLTLADILDLRLAGARLAVLSACETGIPGTKLPDEVIGLPAGLLQAGVAGVVASLWSVNDLSTAMLMERFYRLWRENGLEPAVALRQAQIWLRDSTNREKAEYFRRDVPALAGLRMPAAAAAELYVDYALRTDPDARVFAHPFWWAAFSLTGV